MLRNSTLVNIYCFKYCWKAVINISVIFFCNKYICKSKNKLEFEERFITNTDKTLYYFVIVPSKCVKRNRPKTADSQNWQWKAPSHSWTSSECSWEMTHHWWLYLRANTHIHLVVWSIFKRKTWISDTHDWMDLSVLPTSHSEPALYTDYSQFMQSLLTSHVRMQYA